MVAPVNLKKLVINGLLWWLSGKEPTLPMQETQVLSLGQEDALGKEMETHSSILAWEIIWTEESIGLQSMGLQKSQTCLGDQTTITVISGATNKSSWKLQL